MTGRIIRIDPARPDPAFTLCRQVALGGGIVVYPTDTFYGLGADPKNAAAINRLFQIKGREHNIPILLLISDAGRVRDWAAEVGPQAERLMRIHWPGPLTIVFKAKEGVLPALTGGTGTIGLRVPGNGLTRQLLEFSGGALTGTSANISGRSSASTAGEADAALGDKVDLILDGGTTPGGQSSTVVDASAGRVTVLRQGAVEIDSR